MLEANDFIVYRCLSYFLQVSYAIDGRSYNSSASRYGAWGWDDFETLEKYMASVGQVGRVLSLDCRNVQGILSHDWEQVGATVPCYVNPGNLEEVKMEQGAQSTNFSFMVMPLIFASLVVLWCLCCSCCCTVGIVTVCRRREYLPIG